MRHFLQAVICAGLMVASFAKCTAAQEPSTSEVPRSVEITPKEVTAEVGQKLKFTAVAKNAAGEVIPGTPSLWFTAPFDLAGAEKGEVTVYEPGEIRVGAVIAGKTGYAVIHVSPAAPASIDIAAPSPLVVGGSEILVATARNAKGDPQKNAPVSWTSETPSIASVDKAGVVTGLRAGQAKVRASSGKATGNISFAVGKNPIASLSVQPVTTQARTGDVVRFTPVVKDAHGSAVKNSYISWEVIGAGATVYPDGAFVAEESGTYIVKATSGGRGATSSVVVTPRNAERQLDVVAHVMPKDTQTAEQWILGSYAYLSSVSDKLWVYDIAEPAAPKLLDTVTVDARLINDVSTTPDGKIGVITREGASTRKNGIVFLDTSDPSHVKVISDYTATVTGGVHSAYVNGHYAYITDDATGSMRVIDFADVKAPKEVARWQVDAPLATTIEGHFGPMSAGRYLHDLQVLDGLAYLAYWRDGLIILDVGSGVKHGSPEHPQLVSQLRINQNELYGDGWLAGTHTVFRSKNYVYIGDEVYPAEFDLDAHLRIPVRGIVQVVDVSDIEHPRIVAHYSVPEAGAHNIWVEDDVLYMGYYNGGGRILDVSGELRGDLYRQGREIARLWTGDPAGFRTNLPFTWGAQPHNGMIYFNDVNSGLWIVKLGKPTFKGSTTAPGLP
jgi:plastocyanin